MELKQINEMYTLAVTKLLIELYGIETQQCDKFTISNLLLIELYGIETPSGSDGLQDGDTLLIELYGIETCQHNTERISRFPFNRTIWN